MKDRNQQHRVNKIDWDCYLRRLIMSPPFEKVRDFYVPIGIELESFKYHGWNQNKQQNELDQVIAENPKLVLMGEPGAGKSWALRNLVFKQVAKGLEQDDPLSQVPIYTELRDWEISPDQEATEPSWLDVAKFLW